MDRFDCLDRHCPLQGPHLIEASAGTGKTFAVEQIFVRLLVEREIEIDQILAVTFTRAATRELKIRIRSNIEKALQQLLSDEIQWDYLLPFRQENGAIRRLKGALNGFDQSQIFTIHGFCHRVLKEYSFEAKLPFSLPKEEMNLQIPERLQQGVRNYLSYLQGDVLCAEQLGILLKKYKTVEKLANKLLKFAKADLVLSPTFAEQYLSYCRVRESLGGALRKEALIEDFHLLAKNYKAEVKGRFEPQIESFASPPTEEAFRFLISEKGSLFSFLSPANKKVHTTEVNASSEPIFEWGRAHLLPLIQEASDPKVLFKNLLNGWIPCAKRILQEEEALDPDAILQKMHDALQSSPFIEKVRQKFQAVVIDEFQDTDPLQWDIFRTLFLDEPIQALFLVGDPKQSIYRFRKADIYTYLHAKEQIAPTSLHHLDTNFRSSAPLIGSLNALFDRDWLWLPKLNRTLPYLPVRAGVKEGTNFPDQKGALHFFIAEGESTEKKWPTKPVLEQLFFPFIANEIIRLKEWTGSLSHFAILVKDRYQAEQMVSFLQTRGIAALAKSHTPLGETFAFASLHELFGAVFDPKDRRKSRAVLAGPFSRMKFDEIPTELPLVFYDLKVILEIGGLVPFFHAFFQTKFHTYCSLEAIACEDVHFYRDLFQIIELLFEWERKNGFSLEGLRRVLDEYALLITDEDERVRRRMESDDEAVQVMTMHVSKGLEFPVVFALGLATRTPKPEEEIQELDMEKLRQLYVAMTRAKQRLYVPIALDIKKRDLTGIQSPMELFLQAFQGQRSLEEALELAAKGTSITWEKLIASTVDRPVKAGTIVLHEPLWPKAQWTPRYLHSFTSLCHKGEHESLAPISSDLYTIHTLPRGKETGIFLHQLFEAVFSSSEPIWAEEKGLGDFIIHEVGRTRLAPWKEAIRQMVVQTVAALPIKDLKPADLGVEVEFIFERPPHFIKGFIDLVFHYEGKIYFIDWKSNWIGESDEAYSTDALEHQMAAEDYGLQATLYGEALQRSFSSAEFGGAYYVFVRGTFAPSKGILFFQPQKNQTYESLA